MGGAAAVEGKSGAAWHQFLGPRRRPHGQASMSLRTSKERDLKAIGQSRVSESARRIKVAYLFCFFVFIFLPFSLSFKKKNVFFINKNNNNKII
jgi:hypothetical protein